MRSNLISRPEFIGAIATTGDDPARPIVVSFDQPMMAGMESFVLVHEGSVTGPIVAEAAPWSIDRTVLIFTFTTV